MFPPYTHRSLLLSGAVVALITSVLFRPNTLPAASTDEPTAMFDADFYGRIDLGAAPPPRILYEPMIIERSPRQLSPIYLRVRPGHARLWKVHCHEYRACGQRVYFVQEDWYRQVYAVHYAKAARK